MEENNENTNQESQPKGNASINPGNSGSFNNKADFEFIENIVNDKGDVETKKVSTIPNVATASGNDLIYDNVIVRGTAQSNPSLIETNSDSSTLAFFPRYSISDYSKDLNNWRKQIDPFGIKGCFYFKIFFKFDTDYGLLGTSGNTALSYLESIKGLKMYTSELLEDRYFALQRFINSLKNISINTPWFFKEVSNLNNLNLMFTDESDFSMDKFINIHCAEETTDMRLGTLFDLYKFAAYNMVKNKEILPPNLRKFDMSILFMHIPLKKYHTGFTSLAGREFPTKKLSLQSADNYSNMMSVKMFTFQNCEFDPRSMTEIPEQANNEQSFDLGKNVLKINYGRVYENRINEYDEIGLGADGFLFKEFDDKKTQNRLEEIAKDIEKIYNIHTKRKEEASIYENIYGNFTNVRSQYYLKKLKYEKEGTIDAGNIYGVDTGRIGLGEKRTNTKYLNEKLSALKSGQSQTDVVRDIEKYANKNSFKLNWNANALNYNNNIFGVDGFQSSTDEGGVNANKSGFSKFFIKLGEATWHRTKNAFGF